MRPFPLSSVTICGLTPTDSNHREGLGYGFYFAAYELLVQREMEKKGIGRKEIPMTSAIGYGALAGWAMWLTCVPSLPAFY